MIICILNVFLGYLYTGAAHVVTCYLLLPAAICLFTVNCNRNRLFSHVDIKFSAMVPVLFLISCLVNFNRVKAEENADYFAAAVSVALICCSYAYSIPKDKRSELFGLLAWILSAGMTAVAAIGIYVGLSGNLTVFGGRDGVIVGALNHRLLLAVDPDIIGAASCIALSLILFLLLKKRSGFRSIVLVVMAVLVYTVMTLTGCKIALYASMLPLLFFGILKMRQWISNSRAFVKAVAGIGFGIALCALAFVLFAPVNSILLKEDQNTFRNIYGDDYSNVAEGTIHDNENMDDYLELWTNAVTTFIRDPRSWPTGATPAGALSKFIGQGRMESRFHNGYLGILLSFGILGFLGFLVYLVILAVRSIRLLFTKKTVPVQARFLPVLLLPILTINMMEEMFFTRNILLESNVFFTLTAGFIFMISGELTQNETITF